MSQYTDRQEIHKNTVWYDLDHTDLVDDVSQKSADWLDFITGITMHRGRFIANSNALAHKPILSKLISIIYC